MEETVASAPEEQTLKRKRGRPRKSEPLEQQQPSEKRARGRPRKSAIPDDHVGTAETSPIDQVQSTETPEPHTHDQSLNSTPDRDSVGVPTTVEKRPRGRPRKYKTKEEYQEAGKQYRLAHKARKSMLAAGTISLPPAVNGNGDDDDSDEDSVLDDDSVIPDIPKTSRTPAESKNALNAGIDETVEEHEPAHEERSGNQQLAQRHEALNRLYTELKTDFEGLRRTTASSFIEIESLRKRVSQQDEQIATLRGEFASLKNYNIAVIRQREAS